MRGMSPSPETTAILDEAKARKMKIFTIRNPDGSINVDYQRQMSCIYRIKNSTHLLERYDENWRCKRVGYKTVFAGTLKAWMLSTGYNVYSSGKFRGQALADERDEDVIENQRGYGRARRCRQMIDEGRWLLSDYSPDYRILPDRSLHTRVSAAAARQRLKGKRIFVERPLKKTQCSHRVCSPEVPSWCLERYEPRWKLQLQETPQHLIFG